MRVVIPFAPGGSTDILARLSCQILTQALAQSAVADNVTGAGGTIGAQRVLSASADGYTLLAGTPGPITINPLLLPDITYDAAKDFRGVVFMGNSPAVVVVRKDSPIASFKDLLATAKATPNKLTYASAGIGSFAHLSGELLNWRAGTKMRHVPYRGTAPAATDLLGGRVDLMVENYPSVQSYLAAGQMRALAVGTLQPTSLLPGVPTVAQEGIADFESTSWFGLLVRAGTKQASVDAVNAAINAGLSQASVRQQLAQLGVEPVGGTSQAFDQYLASKLAENRQLIAAANIKIN
ncbi:MAG: Bug family tripartite tricarboxylate transporter substrate binding protein [Janthinobacterium lividum]